MGRRQESTRGADAVAGLGHIPDRIRNRPTEHLELVKPGDTVQGWGSGLGPPLGVL